MKINKQFGFYSVLTDPIIGYDEMTRILVDEGIALVQLRVKDGLIKDIESIASGMRKITLGTQTKLIINDYPQIAHDVSADGVHIGQGDSPIEEVREFLGDDCIIGLSTHSREQVLDACRRGPDYIGMGPVYATPTKKNPDPVIGLNGLRSMLEAATVPEVAIGGIDLSNLRVVLDAGAKNFCMVRQLTQSENPGVVIAEMKRIYNEYYPGFY